MLLFWRWQELWVGSLMKEFTRLRGRLEEAGIRCDYKVVDATSGGAAAGHSRSSLLPPESTQQYHLFVHKKDYEKAKKYL